MADTKTVRISDETKQELDTLGRKGESYDDIIRRNITFSKKFDNEGGFAEWFAGNYLLCGFDDLIADNSKRGYPDFILLKGDKEVRVELETCSSNFLLHRHDPAKVDLVICLYNDTKLPVETIEITPFGKHDDLKIAVEEAMKNLRI